ncbi:MAG: hypothetical protein JF612_14715 [Planctomycetia bacterium]|nr:hypothetical protein [Planctomycetia bacterium]
MATWLERSNTAELPQSPCQRDIDTVTSHGRAFVCLECDFRQALIWEPLIVDSRHESAEERE